MGDGNDDSPLFKGWSTKDLLFVGVSLTGLVAFGNSLDKRVEMALRADEQIGKTIGAFNMQHQDIVNRLTEITAMIASIESKQSSQEHRLNDTEARSIECLRGLKK